jgi:urease accessory protein
MLLVDDILGTIDDARFAGRRLERLPIDWAQAAKRRLRAHTDAGSDVALDLPRGAYLADGAVLHDDGERVIAVSRTEEPALVVRFDPGLPPAALAGQAARLGHAFGNQHVPLDIEGGAIRVPLTTSEQVARDTVAALGLLGASVSIEPIALGAHAPLAQGHAHP